MSEKWQSLNDYEIKKFGVKNFQKFNIFEKILLLFYWNYLKYNKKKCCMYYSQFGKSKFDRSRNNLLTATFLPYVLFINGADNFMGYQQKP